MIEELERGTPQNKQLIISIFATCNRAKHGDMSFDAAINSIRATLADALNMKKIISDIEYAFDQGDETVFEQSIKNLRQKLSM